jgi:hypothetical protein
MPGLTSCGDGLQDVLSIQRVWPGSEEQQAFEASDHSVAILYTPDLQNQALAISVVHPPETWHIVLEPRMDLSSCHLHELPPGILGLELGIQTEEQASSVLLPLQDW